MSESMLAVIEENDLQKLQKTAKVNEFLNKHPRKEWIREHPFVKGVEYLPVGKVEMLLDIIFGEWDYEIIDSKILANSVVCHIRLTVKNPVTGSKIIRDGIGAVPLELEATKYSKTQKNEKGEFVIEKQGARHSLDFEYLNRTAVMKNLPAAKSFALKDAADTLGNLFGRSLNRDREEFTNFYSVNGKYNKFDKEVKEKIDSFTDVPDLLEWANSQSELHSDPDFEKYVQQKIALINGK